MSEHGTAGVEGTDVPEAPVDASELDEPQLAEATPVADEVAEDGAPDEVVVPDVEDLLTDLERVTGERDSYLALAQGKQAELENYKKRVMKQQADHLAQATASLVEKLLPVLDAFDAGVRHGDESLAPLRAQLLGVLEKEGLDRLEAEGAPFDPTEHEAVATEPGDGAEPVVAEAFRAGYRWNGRLVRPAMVRVRH
ncbi:nucleotide exchange factor GrpE [soil metagenome]|nr:nucleotide exchange factor GrpE [Acidimicrobiia bacterium]